MQLIDVIEMFNGKVSGGGEYEWDCYPDGHTMDFGEVVWTEDECSTVGHCVFSTKTQRVYTIELTKDQQAFRWIDPEFVDQIVAETKQLGFDHNIAWDDVSWQDVSVLEITGLAMDAFNVTE